MPDYPPHRFAHACFSRPRVADGLPVKSVFALFQESLGFVWVGTQMGLVRLDAGSARRFRHNPDDPSTSPGTFILSLGESLQGDIWVGAYEGGCARYDRYTERFTPVDLQPWSSGDRVARCFMPMGDGRMWVGTNGSLTAVEPERGGVSKFRPADIDTPGADVRYTALLPLDDRLLLVGATSGAYIFDTVSGSARSIPFENRGLISPPRHNVAAMIRDDAGGLLVATGRQLYRGGSMPEALELVEPLVNHPSYGARFAVTSLAADSIASRVWIGTSVGLLRMEANGEGFTFFPSDDSDPLAPCGPETSVLLRDRSGMLWVGAGGGISLLDLRYNFRYHRVVDESLRSPLTVSGIAEDEDGKLWLATPIGLWEYDPATGEKRRYSLGGDTEQTIRENDLVREVRRGREGSLWIGSVGGLFRWDRKTGTVVERYHPDAVAVAAGGVRSLLAPSIKGVLEDSEGFVWSGSDVGGVQRLDPSSGTFRYYRKGDRDSGGIPHDTMLTSLQDRRGRLWFGFVTSLARYDRPTDTFESFGFDPADHSSLSNSMVTALYEDAAGTLWVGTAGGLNRAVESPEGKVSFVRYGARDLPADFITSIIGHGDELWLGTNRGIVRFSEREGRIETRLYDRSDGLHAAEYNLGCAIRGADGVLSFGGRSGFDRFDPDRLLPDLTPPPAVLTELLLFNESVRVDPSAGRGAGPSLKGSITHLRDLTLTYRQSVVTIGYAALHYRAPEKIRYGYILEGFDREWNDAGGRDEATYTNLDPGRYLFKVRAVNSDGLTGGSGAGLMIHVEPPPWRTWWAHTLYGMAGAATIASFTRWRIAARERELREQQAVERARLEERENIRRKNAADFHDEAGTTLTRILLLTELARRNGGGEGELGSLLEKVEANAAHLAQGMRDFIWVLDPDKDTLLDTLQRIDAVGESLFATLDTSFTMRYDYRRMQGVTLDLDYRRQILMICKEALNNVARHAGAATVQVLVSREKGAVVVTVIDDGGGLPAGGGSAGYGMKSMRRRAESIGATLTLESGGAGAGTRVELKIPHLGD